MVDLTTQRNEISKQSLKNGPELQFWESMLSMRIDGVKEDLLRICFTRIDENDWDREFSFVVDLSDRDYNGKQRGFAI
jgi:kinetochore protein Spc25